MSAETIHVVDDDDAMRLALVRLLRAKGYEVRAYASAGDFLVSPPVGANGCLILDLQMPGPSGLALQEALERYGVTLPIVFLTGHGDVASSVRAMKAGALDFLTKPVEPEVLLEAVANALARDAKRQTSRAGLAVARARRATLTEREREVFERVVSGARNKSVAVELGIAERTVKAHRHEVMAKMGARTLAELIDMAYLLRQADERFATPTSHA